MGFALDYPAALPASSIASLLGIIVHRQLAARRADFAHHAWILQGYTQRILLGPGVADEAAKLELPPLTDDEAVRELTVLAEFREKVIASLPIPWKRIQQWLIRKAHGELIDVKTTP